MAMELLTGKGRVGRLDFFVRGFVLSAIGLVLMVPSLLADDGALGLLLALWTLVVGAGLFWAQMMLAVQRCHDVGWSGLLALPLLIPLFGGLYYLVLLFMPGQDADNRYGGAHGAAPRPVNMAEHRSDMDRIRQEAAQAYAARQGR
ncbi:MAG: DUF805 domain-containing protein [Actinomycetota bacterium]